MAIPSRTALLVAAIVLGGGLFVTYGRADKPVAAAPAVTTTAAHTPVAEFRVSGPFTHENLTVFLLHGADTLPPRSILTLDEALGRGSFVVHETGSVNTLVVENTGSDDDVLIQPGDIVKGGKQDRLIGAAVLVPAKSGLLAVPAFCVEHGRWQQRGGEAAVRFAKNDRCIAGKELRQAALVDGQQQAVWENVEKLTKKLSENVGKPVSNSQSPSSLQLALEDDAVAENLRGYETALAGLIRGSKSAIGYVIAVNGKVSGAEVFGSSAVLAKAWPKAVRAAAVEALSERTTTPCATPTISTCVAFLADAERGEKQVAIVASNERGGRGGRRNNDAIDNVVDFVGSGQQMLEERVDGLRLMQNASPQQPEPFSGRSIGTRSQQAANGGGNMGRNSPTPGPEGHQSQPINAAPLAINRTSGTTGVMVESRNPNAPGVVIHRSFVAK